MRKLFVYKVISISIFLAMAVINVAHAKENLKNQIQKHQVKINKMTDEIMKLDNEIDASVSEIIDYISSVKDSAESRSKVITKKEETVKALTESIDFYRNERSKRLSKYKRRASNSTKKELAGEIEGIDAKIDERIDQIVQITSSLTQSGDFKKYTRKWNSNGKAREVITKEYKQNEVVASKTKRDQKIVVEKLKEEVGELENKNKKLEIELKRTSSEEKKQWIKDQIEKNSKNIEVRNQQAENLEDAPEPVTTPLKNEDVREMDEKLVEMTSEIQKMRNELVKLDIERDRERAIIKPMKIRLNRIKKQAK